MIILGIALAAAAAALPTPPLQFGRRGQVAPLGGIAINYTDLGQNRSATEVDVSPTLLFFPANHFAMTIGGSYRSISTTGQTDVHGWTLGAEFGACLDLGPRASLLPLVGIEFGGHSTTFSGDISTTSVTARAPLLFEPVPHFFFGFGPALIKDLSTSNAQDTTTISFQTLIGGWL